MYIANLKKELIIIIAIRTEFLETLSSGKDMFCWFELKNSILMSCLVPPRETSIKNKNNFKKLFPSFLLFC